MRLPMVLRYLLGALHDAADDDPADDLDEYAVDDETPVIDAVGAAWRTYVARCETVPPDPAAFAAWFVELRLAHPMYRHDLPAADLLRPPGVLAACRSRLDGHQGDADAVWSRTDEVLQAIGDTNAYVAFLAGDLTTYERYARIAEALVAAGRTDEAVSWLEGARHPKVPLHDPPTPVVELLAHLYTDQDRLAEALEVRRRHFTATRTETACRALKQAGDRASVDWTPLRAGVLDLLRRDAPRLHGADTLVRVLLAEGEPDEAWATARRYRCESHTLVMAAQARAVNHPADAIDVYRDQIDQALVFHDRDRNRAYERVVDLLLILRELVTRAGGRLPRGAGQVQGHPPPQAEPDARTGPPRPLGCIEDPGRSSSRSTAGWPCRRPDRRAGRTSWLERNTAEPPRPTYQRLVRWHTRPTGTRWQLSPPYH